MSKLKNAPDQSIPDLFNALIKKGNPADLLPFLEKYADTNKTALRQEIKKARKYWLDYVELSQESLVDSVLGTSKWGQRGNRKQQDIVVLSAIAVLDKSEIMRWDDAFAIFNRLSEPHISSMLEWTRPTWINDYLLAQLKKSDGAALYYMNLRLLEQKELVSYDPELFVLSLSRFPTWIFQESQPQPQLNYVRTITQDKVAFNRDVPLLFEYETGIQNQVFAKAPGESYRSAAIWELIFNQLLGDGKIDRRWFIENCILVQTKEWNSNLRAFFRKRLDDTSPTEAELLTVQYLLFACLNASLNTVINFAVDQIRKIWHMDDFDFQSFLDYVQPVMMRSDCKGSIRNLLTLFDKAVPKRPEHRTAMSHLAADVFVIPDLALQERALKTLKKIGDSHDTVLTDKLTLYVPQMQGNVPEMLAPFVHSSHDAEQSLFEDYFVEIRDYTLLNAGARVPQFDNWSELLFHFGKFIQSWDVIDAERLMDAFITKRHLFPADAADQLKTYADQLSGIYFPAVYKQLVKELFIHLIKGNHGVHQPIPEQYRRSNVGNVIIDLIIKVQEKIANGSNRSLLSFPTHLPHWIDPSVLIDRIIAYHEADEPIAPIDLVIAISRTRRENVEQAIQKIGKLPDRYQQLISFMLGATDEVPLPGKTTVWKKFFGSATNTDIGYIPWAVAARTFYPDRVFREFEQTDLKDAVNVVAPFVPEVKVDIEKRTAYYVQRTEAFTLRRLVVRLPSSGKPPAPGLLYSADIYNNKDRYWGMSLTLGGVLYWHSIMPQNDQALATYLLRFCCEYAEGEGHEDLRGFLHVASHPEFRFTETVYYLIACAFVYKDTALRNYAAEVLLFLIQEKRIDLQRLGEKVTQLTFEGYAPFQRFLDVAATIRDHSAVHNGALRVLFDTILVKFHPDGKLPTGFKKLLEMYYDLLTKTKQEPSEVALWNLAQLPQSASLKQVLKQLQSISQK